MLGTGTTQVEKWGTLAISGSNVKELLSRTLVNKGMIECSGTGEIWVIQSAITNNGTFQLSSDVNLQDSSGFSSFLNKGQFVKTVGTVPFSSTVEVPFTNIGSVDAQDGNLHFSTFVHQSGVVKGKGHISFLQSLIWKNGTFEDDSPEQTGTAAVAPGCIAQITSNNGKTLRNRPFYIAGTMTWDGGDILLFGGDRASFITQAGGLFNLNPGNVAIKDIDQRWDSRWGWQIYLQSAGNSVQGWERPSGDSAGGASR